MGFFDDDDIEPTIEQLVVNDARFGNSLWRNEMLSEARRYVYDGKDLIPFLEELGQIRNAAQKEWHEVLYKNRDFLLNFYAVNSARLAIKVSNAQNYVELSTNSRMACLAVLLRDCALHLNDLSDDFRKQIIQFLSPFEFNSKDLQDVASKCAQALDSYLGSNKYEALWDRFKSEEHILEPFTKDELKIIEVFGSGTLQNLEKTLEEEEKVIRSEQDNKLLSLLCDKNSLLPFYYEVLLEVKCKNQDQAKMACLIMAGICKHASKLKDDDLKVVIGKFDLFGKNFIRDYVFDVEEIFRLVQQLSFDFLENTLKDEIFAKGCPNNDCSQTLIEACCRTFENK